MAIKIMRQVHTTPNHMRTQRQIQREWRRRERVWAAYDLAVTLIGTCVGIALVLAWLATH